jgi:hypothetical protein
VSGRADLTARLIRGENEGMSDEANPNPTGKRQSVGMGRIAWIAVIALVLFLALAFLWLASSPAVPDEGPTFFRGPDGKLPQTTIRR